MSDTDDDFEDNASLNSDSDMDDTDVGDEGAAEQDGEPQSAGEEDTDMQEIGEDYDNITSQLNQTQEGKVESEKSKSASKTADEKSERKSGKSSSKVRLSKKAQSMCAVPGCKSKFLWTIGVNLSSFGVPQPTDPKFKSVWLKWLHALGISSSEEESRTCSRWARICELHFTEDCFAKDWEHAVLGKKARSYKRLVPGSYPTLNVSVPEEVLEDPRLLFHMDPIIGDRNAARSSSKTNSSTLNDPNSEEARAALKARIMEEADARVKQELAKAPRESVIPESLLDLRKGEYDRRVQALIESAGIKAPPLFIDDLYRKLGVSREVAPAPRPVQTPSQQPAAAALPPCTILRPVAKEGDPPLPAIVLPGMDNEKAVKLLEDPNIQELLKKMAEKHKEEMAKKMAEEGGDEEEEEFINEAGETEKRMKKKTIPPPPMIILQASDPNKPSSTPDIVQQAIDKTFHQSKRKQTLTPRSSDLPYVTIPDPLPVSVPGPSRPTAPPTWAHQRFLDSLPPIDSRYVLNDEGNIVTASTADHDYGQEKVNGIPIFDPTGLRQEVEKWRLEVETLRRKNYELKIRLSEGKYNRKAAQFTMKIGYKSVAIERKKFEKLESSNRKLQEEVVRLKLERRRMMNKERNRKRKRKKVLERRQKRRDWIMEQIELGNMTKEHLELVYSRKKLPYEKKNVMPGTSSSMQEQNETVTLITIPNADHQQIQVMEDNSSAARANPTVMGGRSRARVGGGGRQAVGKNQQQRQNMDDLSGISSVVVTTSDGMQHHQHDLTDENVVAVSGIPGVVISSGGMHSGTHQIIVEGGSGEEYTHEQIDFIVKAVDDMEANGWKVASPRHFQRQHY